MWARRPAVSPNYLTLLSPMKMFDLIITAAILFTINTSLKGAQMADTFSQRPRESSMSATFTANTAPATLEAGELPGMHGNGRNHTVWAEWVAPTSGWVVIDTQ